MTVEKTWLSSLDDVVRGLADTLSVEDRTSVFEAVDVVLNHAPELRYKAASLVTHAIIALRVLEPGRSRTRSGMLGGNPRAQVTALTIRAFIDAHYAEESLSLALAANALGLSACHVTRTVLANEGRSFVRAVNARRVDQAQHLLVTTMLSIKEIAARSGFACTTKMDRHFKRQCGMSPATYRRKRLLSISTHGIDNHTSTNDY